MFVVTIVLVTVETGLTQSNELRVPSLAYILETEINGVLSIETGLRLPTFAR